ncbi:hypothetical protein Tco_1213100 [Tanacetum coccineum]
MGQMLFPSSVPDTKLVLYPLQDKLTCGDKSLNLSAFKLSRLFFSFLSSGLLAEDNEDGEEEKEVKEVQRPTKQRRKGRRQRHLQNLAMRTCWLERHPEMAERHQELQFYLQPHDHLSGPELEMTLDLKRAIKER